MTTTQNSPARWPFLAFRLFLAASLALAAAVALGLQNPFWAAMPVWVVAQPWRQDLLLRGVLRVAGTLIGAALGWAALHWLPSTPLLILFLALALSCGTVASYWIGNIYNYGVQLAAITVAVVLVPAMVHHLARADDILPLARDRILCTLIGVVAVTATTFLFTPRHSGQKPERAHPDRASLWRRAGITLVAGGTGGSVAALVGGPIGMAAGMALSIFPVIIGSMRHPQPVLYVMPRGVFLGVIAALCYRVVYEILPATEGAAFLLALPFLALGASLRANPKTAPLGLDANMVFLLAAEAGIVGHGFSAYLQGGAALILCGIAVAASYHHLLRPERA
ncbi:FUSC family protein [Xinfangfangia pollutisoli]|uniref:FUSC family protein n=1 Tax=Xinfangfangia pollutisoli TaxID=2865960 RepID=UPI001CD3CF4E|nr:FUSC family protein [Xinfangfangia pollutisoli]